MSNVTPGQRFGRWTVIEQAPGQYHGQRLWICRCDCGAVRNVPSYSLSSGRSLSCGCLSAEVHRASAQDLTGKRFGRLTVLERRRDGKWLCHCDCGNTVTIKGAYLLYGSTASCGCLRVDRIASMEEDRKRGQAEHRALLVDGTALDAIKPDRKVNKNSRTGVRGVSLMQDGRYRATITLRRKQYDLGIYDTVQLADAARKEAEERLYRPILEEHGR